MKLNRKLAPHPRLHRTVHLQGFSTLELVVTLTVILLLGAIASPLLMRSLRVYQLNSSATQLADIVKLTRFDAIRNNKNADVRIQQNGATWLVWRDSNINGTADPTETRLVLGGYADMLASGAVPDPSPIAAALGGGGTLILNTASGANGSIRFDARGAVVPVSTVYVFYLGNAVDAASGYRAVLVMPAGTTQIWSASAAGDWRRIS
jgi:type II secretory pathway pseudopilin PulG